MKPLQNSISTLHNHLLILVHHYGDIIVSENLVLKDVLLVSDFKFNLISIHCLTQDPNIVISFSHILFDIQDISMKKMIDKGETHGELYMLSGDSSSQVLNVTAHAWHYRLGHISFKRLES